MRYGGVGVVRRKGDTQGGGEGAGERGVTGGREGKRKKGPWVSEAALVFQKTALHFPRMTLGVQRMALELPG